MWHALARPLPERDFFLAAIAVGFASNTALVLLSVAALDSGSGSENNIDARLGSIAQTRTRNSALTFVQVRAPPGVREQWAASRCCHPTAARWFCGMTSGAQTGAEFVGFLEAWLESLYSAGRSRITVECYRRDLGDFKRVAGRLSKRGNIDMKLVGQEQLDLIASAWKAEAASPQTIARRLSALRGFARFLMATGRTDCARLMAARVAGAERTRRPVLSDQQASEILSADLAAIDDWTGRRDLAMFAVGADGALATAEIAALNREDLDADSVCVRTTCFRPRMAGLSRASRSAIDAYLAEVPFDLPFDGPLFVNRRGTRVSVRTIQLRFGSRARRLGIIGSYGPGSLRAHCADRLAMEGQSSALIAAALGLHPLSALRFFSP